MSDTGVVLYDPTAEPKAIAARLAARLSTLEGKRVGILDNSKANAGTLMLAVAQRLRERYGVSEIVKRKEYVFEHARFPLGQLGEEYRRYFVEARKQIDDPGTLLPIANSPEAITVIVVGGAGKHSSWQPTFGDGTKPTRRVIARKDGTPLSSVAEIRRGGPTPT